LALGLSPLPGLETMPRHVPGGYHHRLISVAPPARRTTISRSADCTIDGFQFAVARKTAPEEAEFFGLCILMTDQSWAPFHLRLRVSTQGDKIEWLECRLGESGTGNGGMLRTPYGSVNETKLLYSMAHRLESIPWAYRITRGAP